MMFVATCLCGVQCYMPIMNSARGQVPLVGDSRETHLESLSASKSQEQVPLYLRAGVCVVSPPWQLPQCSEARMPHWFWCKGCNPVQCSRPDATRLPCSTQWSGPSQRIAAPGQSDAILPNVCPPVSKSCPMGRGSTTGNALKPPRPMPSRRPQLHPYMRKPSSG